MMNKPEAIAVMLSGFPVSQATDPEASARAYLIACEASSEEAVDRAANEYILGQVEGHDNRYAPTAAEFAVRCRLQDKIMTFAAKRAIKKPEVLADLSDEERKRIASRMKDLGAGR